uniref:Uncharacterized protein n=1 Tax=Lepeophtheirus salmonis TaxID=72036 RepID=A0A0K2TXN8_LEPSM
MLDIPKCFAISVGFLPVSKSARSEIHWSWSYGIFSVIRYLGISRFFFYYMTFTAFIKTLIYVTKSNCKYFFVAPGIIKEGA